jgi:hypothetical protein
MIPPTLATPHAGYVSSPACASVLRGCGSGDSRRAFLFASQQNAGMACAGISIPSAASVFYALPYSVGFRSLSVRERTMIVAYLLVGVGCYLLVIRCVLALFEMGE